MNIDDLKSMVNREIKALRDDLIELKRCQLQYFSLAITATGAIFGLTATLNNEFKGFALLAPLAIILPNWVIFFDKATTITRIVGYQRILEKQMCANEEIYNLQGYENSLSYFRANEKDAWDKIRNEFIETRPPIRDVFLLKIRHRFWMLNFYTFALLSLTCCIGSYILLSNDGTDLYLPFGKGIYFPSTIWAIGALIVYIFCVVYTWSLVYSLTRGKLSYECCALKWEKILRKLD